MGAAGAHHQAMRSTERNTDSVGVLERASRLLACFTATRPDMSLSDLARRSSLPKSTVHRLLLDLEHLGFVECRDGRVSLGLRLFELGQLVPRRRELREAALPFMEDLREVTRQTVHLAVRDGLEVVYLEILGSHEIPRLPSRSGGRMPLYCTGVGKALLAHSDPATVDAVIAAGLHPRTPYTITSAGLLRDQLHDIRQTGIAHDHEESGVNFACTASPVFDRDGAAVAALSVTGRLPALRADRTAPAVRTAALALSRALGHRPSSPA
jgi:DNA-binding IclR family transcriptional regulator